MEKEADLSEIVVELGYHRRSGSEGIGTDRPDFKRANLVPTNLL